MHDDRQEPKSGTPERDEYDRCNNVLWHATGGMQLGWTLANTLTWMLVDECARWQRRVDDMADERDVHMAASQDHAATHHTNGVQSLQKQIRELQLSLAAAEALVLSHEGHIARLEQRVAGLESGGAKVRDQLAYHLERNSKLSAEFAAYRKAHK